MKHGSDRLTLCFSAGLVLVELAMGNAPEGWGARRTTGAPQSLTGCKFRQSKTGAQPHLLLGCDECWHTGISLSKISRSYDGKLTGEVFLAEALVASCLRGALPKVTPVNFLCAEIKWRWQHTSSGLASSLLGTSHFLRIWNSITSMSWGRCWRCRVVWEQDEWIGVTRRDSTPTTARDLKIPFIDVPGW